MLSPRLIVYLLLIGLLLSTQVSLGQIRRSGTFYLYEDRLKQLNGESALRLFREGKFQKIERHNLNPGFTRSIFWLAFNNEIDRHPDSLLLNIGHHHINRIHLYYATDSSMRLMWLTGDYYPFSQRPTNNTGF